MRAHYVELQRCYRAALETDPDLHGELSVVFEVGGDGAVSNPVVDFSTLQGPTIEPCVLEVFGRLMLPPPPRPDMKIRYPMVFTSPATPEQILTVLEERYHLDRGPSSGEQKDESPRNDYDAPW